MEYTFTLKYELSEQDCNHDDIVAHMNSNGPASNDGARSYALLLPTISKDANHARA